MAKARIHIGVGGWTFPPWRGVFYPKGLPHKDELAHAGKHLTGLEINGTYYRLQSPESFAKWHDEVPEGFVFALKGSRFVTNRRVLAEAGPSLEKFCASGLSALKDKLGPINWQLAGTKQFDAEDIDAFLGLLPKEVDGVTLRHAMEARHESFRHPEFIDIARKHGVAVVIAADSEFPLITDLTAPFAYLRIMGTTAEHPAGYAPKVLDAWAKRAQALAKGEGLDDLAEPVGKPGKKTARDVFLFVISGEKERNPAAAVEIIGRMQG
ncbi:DUF72 domain-containing protein [Roseomonas terrae]|jgi:uncharacterized protein YecE (DUF72 family)|uniref:DUF72 domain-containing protein n=1 Tax=Neoroseomonas terrae TaxID=424799 RepID=A0ABS5EFM9_9PROT|nr:DUF72 domain-containing protein [Neoroseomonas terrae]MBR0649482.1 DUF72 domain-containing protein [Neoroseomonas terrae]